MVKKIIFALLKYWNKFYRQLPYLSRTLKLIKDASGKVMIVWVLLTIVQGILPVLFVYLLKPFIDLITKNLSLLKDPNIIIHSVLPEIIILALILFGTEVVKSIGKWVRVYQSELVKEHIQSLIHKKSLSLDLGFFESSEFYDKLYRARNDAISRPIALLENLGYMLQNVITLLSILSLLFLYKWWLPFVLIMGVLPTLPLLIYQTLRFHKWRMRVTIEQRKMQYYDFLLTERESAAEIRLFNLGNYFEGLFLNISKSLRNGYSKINKSELITELIIALWGMMILGTVMLWLLYQAISGSITFGSLTMFYMAFDRSQKSINTLIGNLSEVYKNIMFIENMFEFFDIEPKILSVSTKQDKKFQINKSVKLENVSFKYPFSERMALDNLNMEIEAGKITAVVGTNGAGKSTLIKMLCRFYDPQSGKISIDDSDYRDYNPEEIQSNMVVLFQEYLKFYMKVYENIGLGDYRGKIPDITEIEDAAIQAGADAPIQRLPEKYQTMLGRWFIGSELSTGEWQRVALSRVFLKKASFIIFDEPTSAMDSWAEADWLNRFKKRVKDHTTLIITHRFTTAMQADIIYVMDRGKVIEKGTHNELMAMNGQYSISWKNQTEQIEESK